MRNPNRSRAAALGAALFAVALAACEGAPPSRPAAAVDKLAPMPPTQTTPPTFAVTDATDPYLWLEDADSPRAIAWARAQNERTLGVLEGDPRYATFHRDALAVWTTRDRIPQVDFAGGDDLRDFWQDQKSVRGLWRQTTLGEYRKGEPAWQTILDVDELARRESANWIWKGAPCLPPQMRRCLVNLSDGGKDAVTVREFDAVEKRFVEGGFVASESKQDIEWYDADTLYIARDWGGDTLTTSGYPFVVKRWTRGTPLADAKEVFRGAKGDVAAGAMVLRDPDGRARGVIIEQAISFFEARFFLVDGERTIALPLPLRSRITGFVDGQLIVTLREDMPSQGFLEGDLVSFDLAAMRADAGHAQGTLVLRPAANESVGSMGTTRDRLLVGLYRDVKGTLLSFAHAGGAWKSTSIAMPENGSIGIAATDDLSNRAIVTSRGFLVPTEQWLVDAGVDARTLLRALPAQFDASRDVVLQQWAVSSDGTRIPYFVVRPKDLPRDGSAPTLLYAYGGFQDSQTPWYSGTFGRLWLERGGVLVVANIRGGGEFGPRWHRAGLKEHRQQVFDDFYAVARSVIADGTTSPRRLGIMGGSNGGLLMGVALTQHPELFNAVVIQVPLFDMLRYTKIGAGASWIGEYGDPDIPAERAYIERYSPYQHLVPGMHYPEVFFETSTKDDRVHPAHARKAAARLEALGYPVLYHENIDGGHGADANLVEGAQRSALEFTYLARRLMD
jgi:prolyl oligopeptidase